MARIYFKKDDVRCNFFNDILRFSDLNKWKQLRNKFKIPRTNLERYRNGKWTIPDDVYKRLTLTLPNNLIEYYSKEIDSKEDNWGSILGGKNNYIKNKYIYDANREKAWVATRNKYLVENINLDIPLNTDFYEVVGAFIGDGFLNKYGHTYTVQFAGDSRFDMHYYKNKIIPVIQSLVDRKPYIRIKENSMWVTFSSKYLLKILKDRFNMPAGKKVYTVKIPDEILKDKNKLSFTLRGIFDTDGCVSFDKRKVYKKPYIRIAIQLSNFYLIEQISRALNLFNIRHTKHSSHNINSHRKMVAHTIQINGLNSVKKYCELIGFSNQRHLKKLNFEYIPSEAFQNI